MIFQSVLLHNLISLCMKLMNSLVLIGLYYGFLTTFSIGPSYLFLIKARFMEEETEKKISATTGFITGQLMMFISIYYVPFHLALGRPHTITAITILYLFFQLLGNSDKNLFHYGYKNRNSIRNFSILNIFLKNLIFQLLNPFFLPSSMLIRLVNIYLFRHNNKLLFFTSSFIGWLIGHIFLMKCIELIFIWIRQNNSMIKSIRKYIMLELRNYTSDIYEIFIFFSRYETILVSLSIIFLYYSGKTPFPFLMVEIQEMNEIEKKNVEQMAGSTKKEQNLYKINKKKNSFGFVEKPLINTLFNYKQWNRPNRYIKNDQFEDVIRNETSEFFFHTCQSDGKERISFTYPQNLSTFHKMMETKMDFITREKDELSNYWNDTNKEKTSKLSNEFLNRAKALDKKFIPLDIFENRIKLSNDIKTKTKYLPKIYDPFLNGPFRGRIQNCFSPSIKNEKTYKKNDILINKIYGILFYNINSSNYPEFEQKINTFERKSLVNEFLFDAIRTDLSNKTIVNRKKKKCIGINEITKKVNELSKKVPLWSYKFIDEIQQVESEGASDFHILSRDVTRDVIFTHYLENDNTDENTIATENTKKNEKQKVEYALLRYLQEPDFDRDIIKGSIRAQRRKIAILKFFQTLHSPLFLDKSEKSFLFSFDDFESIKIFFMDWMGKKTESDYREEKKESEKEEDEIRKVIAEREEEKKNKERQYKIISEAWDSIDQDGNGQLIRGCLLIIQWILRKYIIFPSLIITKNIVRMLFFQSPEWSEDYRDWKNEVYIICTYDGVPLAEFPEITDGFQIRVLYPFRLKLWHRSKLRSTEKEKDRMKKKVKKTNFGFLTVYGAVVEAPFAAPSKDLLSSLISFFNPIFKELKKKNHFYFFLVSKVLNERTKLFLKIKPLLFHFNSLFLSRFTKINELSESKKNSTIWKNNPMIFESTIPIESINLENYSLILKKMKNDLNGKTTIIRKQVEQMTQEEEIEKMTQEEKKKGRLINSKIHIYPSKTTSNTKVLGKNILDSLQRLQRIWKILQRRTVRLTRKSYSFLKIFIQRVYIDIFLYVISIPRINIQLFLESKKKYISKSIYNNEINGERTDKTNQKNIINFISIIHKSYNTGNKRNRNSQNSCDVSFLSQAYVFFKLYQSEVINTYKYKVRSVFQYHERFFFLKNEIKDSFFGIQKISHSKLKHKNPPNSLMNQWTNWLKGHYQYDLSQNRWSRLVPKKWRKRINEHHMTQNKDLTKCDSYEKPRLILYKDYKEQQVGALKKTKIKKQYGYDLLSYNSINYADNKDLYIYGYRSPFQTNIKRTIYSNYNTNKKNLFDTMNNISIKHYVEEDAILDMEKNLDRKYFDWIGINVEISNRSISNPKFWFFLEFMIFHNAYRINPRIIPIKLLFFHFNGNQNVSKNQNNISRPSKNKKSPEFELETQKSSLSNQEKDIEEDFKDIKEDFKNIEEDFKNIEDIKKDLEEFDNKKDDKSKNNKKGDKSKKKLKEQLELQLDLLLKDFVNLHLDWKNSFGSEIYQNIKIYGLLTKLKNFKKVKRLAIASIRREELDLDIPMMDNEMIINFRKNKTMKKGFMIIEPVRLSRRNNKEFFLYQTISISLIHKNKHKIHQGYSEKKRKKNYDLLVPENILSTRRRRELRILMCLNSRNRNSIQNRNTNFDNENKVNNCFEVLTKKRKDRDRDKKKLMNFKIFVWPNYRLEDLACINRYWFTTYNGSRFSIIRLYMYPRLKIR
uniref:hypothetical protein Ycf1 n=1 Tax=Macropsychanthus marginatus TaxID=1457467 RepID=UPI0022013230|nr:hypothetical protein Ycf1 [Macropsychanthus marginatus]UXL85176.1 hypothetical protein Ycf1 [Macropsychanthus marginatus]